MHVDLVRNVYSALLADAERQSSTAEAKVSKISSLKRRLMHPCCTILGELPRTSVLEGDRPPEPAQCAANLRPDTPAVLLTRLR